MAANEISIEMQTSTRFALAWIWLVALLHRMQLSRLIGRDRVNGWALNGCYRLCFFRMRIAGGRWGRWQHAYRTNVDGLRESVMP